MSNWLLKALSVLGVYTFFAGRWSAGGASLKAETVGLASATDLKIRDGDLLGVLSSMRNLTGVLVLSGRLQGTDAFGGAGIDSWVA